MGGNPIQFDYTLIFLQLLPIGLFALAAYFMVNILRYLKRKAENDRELIQKIDELIKLQQESNKVP